MPPKKKPTRRHRSRVVEKPVTPEYDESGEVSDDEVMINDTEEALPFSGGRKGAGNDDPDSDSETEEEEYNSIDDEVEDEDDLGDDVEIDDEDHDLDDAPDSEYPDDDCLYAKDDDLEDETRNEEFLPANQRKTKPLLFHYEYVRLLEDRTEQILRGSKKLIKNSDHLEPLEIAKLELKHNVIPLKIIRSLPNGKRELWKVSELDHRHYDRQIA